MACSPSGQIDSRTTVIKGTADILTQKDKDIFSVDLEQAAQNAATDWCCHFISLCIEFLYKTL